MPASFILRNSGVCYHTVPVPGITEPVPGITGNGHTICLDVVIDAPVRQKVCSFYVFVITPVRTVGIKRMSAHEKNACTSYQSSTTACIFGQNSTAHDIIFLSNVTNNHKIDCSLSRPPHPFWHFCFSACLWAYIPQLVLDFVNQNCVLGSENKSG